MKLKQGASPSGAEIWWKSITSNLGVFGYDYGYELYVSATYMQRYTVHMARSNKISLMLYIYSMLSYFHRRWLLC